MMLTLFVTLQDIRISLFLQKYLNINNLRSLVSVKTLKSSISTSTSTSAYRKIKFHVEKIMTRNLTIYFYLKEFMPQAISTKTNFYYLQRKSKVYSLLKNNKHSPNRLQYVYWSNFRNMQFLFTEFSVGGGFPAHLTPSEDNHYAFFSFSNYYLLSFHVFSYFQFAYQKN